MNEIQQRISELALKIAAIDDHERELLATLAKLRQPLVDELDALRFQVVQARMSDPVLNVGDKLVVTRAFWNEKERAGAVSSFTGDPEWGQGSEVVVKDMWINSTGEARVSIETPHSWATTVTIDTAQDMRRAYLKRQEVTNG